MANFIIVRDGIGNKLDFLNKMATVKARKVFFFQLFLLYPMSIRIHFSRHSKHRLVAVANFSLVKVLITPTKVSLRLSLPRERSVSSSFTLQNKKKSTRAKPGD